MKTQIVKKMLIIGSMIMLLSTVTTWAQPGRGQGKGQGQVYACQGIRAERICENLPGITDEQQEQISALRATHLKEMNTLRNDVAVKRAELVQLETADKSDTKLINSKIDEIYAIKGQMAKERSQHRQQARSQLTEEQQVYFNAQRSRGKGRGYANGNGYYRCLR